MSADTSSYVGDDVFSGGRGVGDGKSPISGGGLTSRVEREPVALGRNMHSHDKRKVRFDVLGARREGIMSWHVTKDDRMSANDAGDALEKIFAMWQIDKENPGIQQAALDAILFCHTLNSGSVLQPGRSKIKIGAHTEFDFADIVVLLGVDTRRFFRAYADEVRAVNQRVLHDVDYGSVESVERRNWLLEVAMDRGLQRYPDLAHDSSDKCVLMAAERLAVANAKVGVFDTIVNAVDSMNANSRTMTADKYDSTNKRVVPSYVRN